MQKILVAFGVLVALASAQQRDYTTPVPILKQINRHNEDGSYSFGYEGADGSFKIETKYANGEVFGKYGYVDDQGKLREVEYGASRRGFEPQGSDINVPPPTLVNTNKNVVPLGPDEEDDGQYREDPAIYYNSKSQYNSKPAAASNFHLNSIPNERSWSQPQQQPQYQHAQPQQQPQYQQTQPQHQQAQPQYQRPAQPQYQSQFQHQPTPAPYHPPQPQYNPPQQQYYNPPQNNNWNQQNNWNNHHHPALSNIDITSGSYSVSYTGRK